MISMDFLNKALPMKDQTLLTLENIEIRQIVQSI